MYNFKEITLTNNFTGQYKTAPIGFSWTTLFFGGLPALLRGDWMYAIIMTVVALITCGLSWFIFPFFYNNMYIKNLLKNGYLPTSIEQCDFVISRGITTQQHIDFLRKREF